MIREKYIQFSILLINRTKKRTLITLSLHFKRKIKIVYNK